MANDKKRILIIDDEESIRDGCHQTLSRAGFITDTTGDAQHGMEMSLKDIYDVILLDIRMPKMDGIEMAKKIKENGINAQIIFLTNLKDEAHISQAVEALDETDYIIKSDVHIDQIVARVREKLEKI